MVGFGEAVSLFFKRYTDFQGRSQRSEYWWVQLFNLIVIGIPAVLLFVVGMNEYQEPNVIGMVLIGIMGLYFLAIIIPSIALFIRRLHDINQTGWIYLGLVIAGFIPFVSLLASIAQIVIACIPGTAGPNKYGPDPKGQLGVAGAATFD